MSEYENMKKDAERLKAKHDVKVIRRNETVAVMVKALKRIAVGDAKCRHSEDHPLIHARPEIGVRLKIHNADCPTRIAEAALRRARDAGLIP